MTLMLTLELLSRRETKPGSAATSEGVRRLRAEIEAAATEIDDLQAEIIAHTEAAALSLSLPEQEWTDRCEALEEVNRRLEAEIEDLISAREAAQVAQRQSDRSGMRSELVERLGELKERRKAAEQELAAIESNDSAIFNVSQTQGKRPWLVDLSADRWIALPAEGQ
ncbi:MAG: hypothetical protein KJZ87_05055, partial [Thermoguttaceae bacterium]|nr:hypothetical protein [Thermoguttaceae bacterium]